MRKTLAFILLLLLLCNVSSVKAQEPADFIEDSLTVSDEIRMQIGAESTDTVVKIYFSCSYFPFAEHDRWEEILQSGNKTNTCVYVIYRSLTDYNCFYQFQETITPTDDLEGIHRPTLQMCITGDVIRHISPDAKILQTYYFSGESAHCEPIIVFRTSVGDYVYCDSVDLLMPLDSYCILQKELMAEHIKEGHKVGLSPYHHIWDLSVYKYTSPTFDPDADIHTVLANSRKDNANMTVDSAVHTDKAPSQSLWLWIAVGAGVICVTGVAMILMFRRKK